MPPSKEDEKSEWVGLWHTFHLLALNAFQALFRRGVARMKIGVLDLAKADLMAAYKLDPSNKPVKVLHPLP